MTVPQHSAIAPITFIRSAAFDLELVKTERATMPDGGDGHPVVLYFSGESRYDLDATYHVGEETKRARDYLKPDHTQKVWNLRRLRPRDAAACLDLGGNVGRLTAFSLSAGDKPLTEREVEAHVDEHGLTAICEVGEAALRASEAPKAAEKKL